MTEDTNKNEGKTPENEYLDRRGKFKEGNPGGGRPKGSVSITTALKQELNKIVDPEKKKTNLHLFIAILLKQALKDGDYNTQKLIMNYVEGMPKQKMEIDAPPAETGQAVDNLLKNVNPKTKEQFNALVSQIFKGEDDRSGDNETNA